MEKWNVILTLKNGRRLAFGKLGKVKARNLARRIARTAGREDSFMAEEDGYGVMVHYWATDLESVIVEPQLYTPPYDQDSTDATDPRD